ncbi:PREDICTED: uncharacterized protein LOC104823128 [Tarenaya hassleriana]|uniref:uncharacterized protein LOC104823128 n=1 Tax=Tarenaya hassleriana TaxID=28532 RepID=UPI00053C4AAE|nr:PREDICTED: uncharacterized protein LOC104823128 [Tarenaya hassleriana]
MQGGDCFKANVPHLPADSPPAIPCRCGAGFCRLLASKTPKNPGRRFYTCPSSEQCGFFKWYDGPTDRKILPRPVCPCGSGPCRRETLQSGPDAGRSYFVCGIKKNFGACAFFQWEDAQIPSEPGEGHHGSSSPSSGVSGSGSVDEKNYRAETDMICENGEGRSPRNVVAETTSPANGFTPSIPFEVNEVNQVTDATHHVSSFKPDKECPVFVAGNEIRMEEPNPINSRSNSREITSSAAFGMNHQDAIHHETEEEVLDSQTLKDVEHGEPVEGDQLTNGDLSEFTSKESYEWEVEDEAVSVLLSTHEYETTSNETNNSDLIQEAVKHQPLSVLPFANAPSLLDLIEQYHSEKFNFETVSLRCFEAFSGFVGSYKQLKSLHEKAHRLRKLLVQTEEQIACCEAETLEFAVSVGEVSGQMKESQNRMQEAAEKLAKEIEVFRQRYICNSQREIEADAMNERSD